jgi:dTDP-4-dehydrorhamnose reductase
VVAAGEASWHDYARFVIEWARAHGLPVRVAAEAVQAVPSSEFPTRAKRPHNSRLATGKLCSAFDVSLPHWQTGVQRMLAEAFAK